jgi:O-antigen/teichoic acid export membrane protein
VATFVAVTLGFVLLSLRLHRPLLYANAVALTISVVLTLALTPALGARGAAVASATGETSLAVAYAFVLYRAHVPPVISGRVAVGVMAAVLAALAPLATSLRGIPLVLASSGLYFIVLVAAGGLPRELWEALPFARPREQESA